MCLEMKNLMFLSLLLFLWLWVNQLQLAVIFNFKAMETDNILRFTYYYATKAIKREVVTET